MLTIILVVIVSLVAAASGFFIGRKSVYKRLEFISPLIGAVGRGDLTVRGSSNDAVIGALIERFNTTLGLLAGNLRRVVMQSESVAACVNELLHVKSMLGSNAQETMDAMESSNAQFQQMGDVITKIRDEVGGATRHMETVSTAAEQLSSDITTIAAAAEEASQNVTTMASAAEEMTANLGAVNGSLHDVNQSANRVATAVKAMAASLDEVRERCHSASQKSAKANQHTQSTLHVMDNLASSATEIGKFVELINSIAEQTKMLALNAAIEAAGAGESGKGFAVVANEVKDLARQTAEATNLIAEQVEKIQINSKEASDATQEVSLIVGDMNQANQEITMAVGEQNAALQAISTALLAVTQSSDNVTRNAAELQLAANEVARAAIEAAAGTNEIARSSSTAASAAQRVFQRNQEANELVRSIYHATDIATAAAQVATGYIHRANQLADYMEGSVQTFSILIDVVQGAVEALRASQVSYVTGSELFDVRVVKEGHLVWLRRMEQAIRGQIIVEPSDAGNFKGCSFGLWYYGVGGERLGNHPLFMEIGPLHEKIHTTATEVLTLVEAGDKQGGIDGMVRFGALRADLFKMLDRLYMANVRDDQLMIYWDDSLDIGVKQFNDDHQRLIDLINELHAAMKDGSGKAKMGKILAGLTEFTKTHFAREEAALKKHGYDRYPQQQAAHTKLIAQLDEKEAAFAAGSATVSLDLLSFLQDWLIHHIKGEDMRYKAFFQARNSTEL